MKNPFIQSIPVLSESEVKSLNLAIDRGGFEWHPSTVFSKDNCRVDTSIRSSVGFMLPEKSSLAALVGEKINEALLEYRDRLKSYHSAMFQVPVPGMLSGSLSHREGIQILEYGPEQKYNFHYDMNWDPKAPTHYRTVSVVLYLTNDFEGGGTEFLDNTYKPKPGEALFFPSHWSFPHCGQVVTSGKKRVAVTWYYVYPASS